MATNTWLLQAKNRAKDYYTVTRDETTAVATRTNPQDLNQRRLRRLLDRSAEAWSAYFDAALHLVGEGVYAEEQDRVVARVLVVDESIAHEDWFLDVEDILTALDQAENTPVQNGLNAAQISVKKHIADIETPLNGATASLTKPMPLLTLTRAGRAIFNYFEETNDTKSLSSLSIMCTTMPGQATMNATLSLPLPLPPNSSETRTHVPMPILTFTSMGLAIFNYFEENEAKETVFLTSPHVQGISYKTSTAVDGHEYEGEDYDEYESLWVPKLSWEEEEEYLEELFRPLPDSDAREAFIQLEEVGAALRQDLDEMHRDLVQLMEKHGMGGEASDEKYELGMTVTKLARAEYSTNFSTFNTFPCNSFTMALFPTTSSKRRDYERHTPWPPDSLDQATLTVLAVDTEKTVSEVEETVEDEECKQVEEKVCRNVPKMECQDTPEEVERQVPHEVCWDEAEESRHDAPREVCHQVPRDVSTVVAENAYTKTDVEVCPPVPQEELKKPKTKKDCEIFNESKPILTRKPDEIKQGEYDEFYQSITKDKSGPMIQTHSIAKGEVVFRSLISVPNSQPSEQFNKFGQAAENVKLYVRGVFITDDFKDMIPSYISFVKGVVDSDDKYGAFWAGYSPNIKLGVIEDTANKTRLAKLLRFTSPNGKFSSLAEYVERMKDKQESIFYMAGGSREEVEKSPFVERLLKKGYEVLYLTEAVDEYAISALPEFEERKFQDVVKEGFSFDGDTDTAKTRKEAIKEELSERLGETKGSKNSDDQEMKNQVGPATKEIGTVDEAEAILAETDVVIFAPGAADNPPAVQHAAAQNMDRENHIHPHSSSHSSIINLFPSLSSSKVMTTMYPDTTDSPGNHLQLTPWTLDSSHLSTITFTCVTLAKLCEEVICNQNSIASDETYYEEMAYEEREDDIERNHEGKDFSLEIINPGIVTGDVPHFGDGPGDVPDEVPHPGDGPGDVHSSGDVPVQADLQPGPGDVPGDERAEHQLVQGDAPAAAPQLHKGSPNTIQPLTKMRVLPRYSEFHDKPTLDQILTLNLPGQVLDERQNDRNDQCNKQAVLSMPQDSDVPEEVEKVPVNAENDAQSYEQAVLSVTLDLDDHKEVGRVPIDATYVFKAGDDEAQDVKHEISIHVPPPSSSAQQEPDYNGQLYQEVCGEDEQLAISCFMSAFTKPSKWAMAGDSFTIVQGSAKYSLHQEGDGFIMSVGSSSKHCKMCCTSFNIERKEVFYEASHTKVVIYEASHTKEVIDEAFFSLKYHSYTSELCRVVDREVGIARALLHSCSRNKSMAMQLQNVLSVMRNQDMFNKAT